MNPKRPLLTPNPIQRVALMGMLFALAMAFSYLESFIILPGMIPGIKLGLSNIVTMYCLFFLGWKSAYLLAILKAGFTLITRGITGAALSLVGGLFSITVLILLTCRKKEETNYRFLSICGAVAHNLGQLILARFLINVFLYYYIPVLLVSGVVVGMLTGMIFQWILPYMRTCFRNRL